jgi:DNA-binding MarR family transcriptional regulator
MPRSILPRDYTSLAEIRYRIRRFLVFSERSARAEGLEPQQHQLLLAIRGLPDGDEPTIGRVAERLQLAHHSTVELVNRSCEKDLVAKHSSARDGRVVLLGITPRGRRVLERLAVAHRTELRSTAPALVQALQAVIGDVA